MAWPFLYNTTVVLGIPNSNLKVGEVASFVLKTMHDLREFLLRLRFAA